MRALRFLLLLVPAAVQVSCGEGPAEPGPLSQTLLFVRESPAGRSHAFVMKEDGSQAVRLTSEAVDEACPRWSPDGRKVVYIAVRDSALVNGAWRRFRRLHVLELQSGRSTALAAGPGPYGCATWSPDGRRLVYSRFDEASGSYDIFSIGADGTNEVRLTQAAYDNFAPEWSPDGASILFLANGPVRYWAHAWRMNADGTGARAIEGELCSYNMGNLRWSPDGTRFAYDCGVSHGSIVAHARIDGSDVTVVSQVPGPDNYGYDQVPVWSPDGRRLALMRGSGGNLDVYVVDLATRAATRLTHDAAYEAPYDWRR